MYDLDTSLLRTFVVLAETLSFSKTALRVGRSQSAISAQLKRLEDLMGTTLVERDTRRVALTADGDRLLGHARQVVAAADAMIRRFRGADIEGEVRFASPEDFASAYLPDVLAAFAASHERVQLHVACDLTLRLIRAFEAGEHDIVVIKQDPAERYAGARTLWREPLVWVGPPPERSGEPFETVCEAFATRGRALPLVLAPPPCVYRSRATAALDARHIPWTSIYESPSHAGCSAAVRAGLGYAVMPRALTPPGLAILGPVDGWPALPEAAICLLPAARLSPAAAALCRFIEDRVPAQRGLAHG
ncbi:MAG: LysR family transcriptional regulator [Hyphomicrobiaceae bacterium]|nr:LysR family transcriptional regulator [Hyphomicrobiaceae bacterium]